MAQYFHDYINTIIHGDCLRELQKIPHHCVDLVLTDPPYAISDQYRIAFKEGKPISMDELTKNGFSDIQSDDEMIKIFAELGNHLDRILKEDGSIIIFHDRGRPFLMKPLYDKFILRNMIDFVVSNPPPHMLKNNYRSAYQQCAWFSREKYNLNFLSQREMKNVFFGRNIPHRTSHPTEKPAWMIRPLIERHSKPGDLILDPFVGSGRICVEAKRLGRNYIGIDIEKKWCKVAEEWLKETLEYVPVSKWFE